MVNKKESERKKERSRFTDLAEPTLLITDLAPEVKAGQVEKDKKTLSH